MVLILGLPLAAAVGAGKLPRDPLPEDLGPASIDVSGYPADQQKAYRDVFLPLFGQLGETARAVNSPVIELDPALLAVERSKNPALFDDPMVARVSSDGWKRRVHGILNKPRCCGSCPVLSAKQAKVLWRFLVYDSIARKTGGRAGAWIEHRRRLLDDFKRLYPERFETLKAETAGEEKEGVR